MQSTRKPVRLVLLAALAVLVPLTAHAVTHTVDRLDDASDMTPGDGICAAVDGGCTLRAAFEELDALTPPPADATILLPAGTFDVTMGELALDCGACNVTLAGAGMAATVIRSTSFAIMLRLPGHATIADLTLSRFAARIGATVPLGTPLAPVLIERARFTDGSSSNEAGLLLRQVDVVIRDSLVDANVGVGIKGEFSAIRVERTTVSGNKYGIHACPVAGGELAVLSSRLDHNRYGGIEAGGTSIRVEDSVVGENGAWGITSTNGCGCSEPQGCTFPIGTMAVRRSTIESNDVGGIRAWGNGVDGLIVADSLVRGNGQGIQTTGYQSGSSGRIERTWITNNRSGVFAQGLALYRYALTIADSTLSDNDLALSLFGTDNSPAGSATGAFLQVTVDDSTISDNVYPPSGGVGYGYGGAIYMERNGVHAALRNCTVSGNRGGPNGGAGGITDPRFGGSGVPNQTTFANTILTDNLDRDGNPADCAADLVSEGHNILGTTAGCTFTGAPSDLLGVAADLAPLADNGGPTPTRALLPTSLAIDGGDPATCLATDQRGIARPIGTLCDIGALEDTCANGTPDPGEPCACPPRITPACETTTTTTTTTSTSKTNTSYTSTHTTYTSTTTGNSTSTSTTLPGFGCPASPAACTLPGGSALRIRDAATDVRDRLAWRWSRSGGLDPASLADPLANDAYLVCLYADAQIQVSSTIPPGGQCGSRPCWTRSRSGLRYRNRAAAPDGIAGIAFHGVGASTTRLRVRGTGPNLFDAPTFTAPLRIQLFAQRGGCWEATYSSVTVRGDTIVGR